ncbi:hypothetical protein G3R49_19075 [Shewanella sp. WXL01]|uniref:Glycosyltransferase RgtA/B/C/D-like domain-containing protein n=1 Tax=Shewanella maritima TaxID=2520507 RepID=A0A411PLC7_9GAMM|nr:MULTISPECIES: hypothetical protein [Shewanella]NKF52664.1 hypothetical protein [Shewanella sp. WXL01]QBF84288.1 hypothetical protein EXU30_17620 [Shewanella maritima]
MLSKQQFVGLASQAQAKHIHFAFFAFCLIMLLALYLLPGYWYSPDSFSYYELSKTFFGDVGFYEPNTIRSYFNLEQSAAFPLLYPLLLASLNFLFFDSYLSAPYYNVILTCISYFLLIKVSSQYTENKFLSAAFALGVTLFPGYVDEVLSGRSIPLSMVLFLSFIVLFQSRKFSFAALLLGLCCLVRFDMLALGLFVSLYFSYQSRSALPTLCFVLGLTPWMAYSLTYFDSIWVSDNSWVVKSSVHAYVTDFPASATYTVFNDTMTWLQKVTLNYLKGNLYFLRAFLGNFVLLYLLVLFIKHKQYSRLSTKEGIFYFLLINASLAPFFLSGYFDSRYFYLPILMLGLLFLHKGIDQKVTKSTVALMVVLVMVLPLSKITKGLGNYAENTTKLELRLSDIAHVSAMHQGELDVTYFIKERDDGLTVAPMYGALTGNKVALIPGNLETVNRQQLDSYLGKNKHVSLEDLNH